MIADQLSEIRGVLRRHPELLAELEALQFLVQGLSEYLVRGRLLDFLDRIAGKVPHFDWNEMHGALAPLAADRAERFNQRAPIGSVLRYYPDRYSAENAETVTVAAPAFVPKGSTEGDPFFVEVVRRNQHVEVSEHRLGFMG